MQSAIWQCELQALISTTYSFLHSSDLHLGRACGGFPETIRGRLREACHTVIACLPHAARQAGTTNVLLVGDTFDAETCAPSGVKVICAGSCCPAITTA